MDIGTEMQGSGGLPPVCPPMGADGGQAISHHPPPLWGGAFPGFIARGTSAISGFY